MHLKLMQASLIYSFALVMAATLIGITFEDTFVGYLGFLLAPGIWTVYLMFDVNNHALLPFISAQLINILVYWILFALLLGLSSRAASGSMEQTGQ